MAPAITAAVYDRLNPTTLIHALPDPGDALESGSIERRWLDDLLDTGSGSLKVHVFDPVLDDFPTILAYDNIVRFALHGTDRFAFIIEGKALSPAPVEEDAGRWWEISGRGVLAMIERALVFPEGQVTGAMIRQRTFGFMAAAFDDSLWTNAIEIQRQDAAGTYQGAPDGWPDPLAFWIWSRGPVSGAMPTGTSYFRKQFSIAAATPVSILAAGDNEYRLWLDDDLIIDNLSAPYAGWHDPQRWDGALEAGDHILAVEAINKPLRTGGNSMAAFICSVIATDDNHALSTTILERTDSSWLADDYPVDIPGMTPGQILRVLIEEAQARGVLAGVTLGFDDALDSNSAAWTVAPYISVDIGTNYLNFAKTLMEQHIDMDMSPELVLLAYAKGTQGHDRTTGVGAVELIVGRDFEELTAQGDENGGNSHVANALLLRDQTGALVTREDAVSLLSRPRKESYIELASAPNMAAAQLAADTMLVERAYPTVQMQGKVTEASGPYSFFFKGDLVLMPSMRGVPTETSVLAITVSEDEAGNAIYEVTPSQLDEDA